ncbi:hypothetical protein HDU67_007033 [Dinochytrium kinnereticum]|nr:hypothetical protein HDU67_007033 [Dinochytrium kinnereticum]
MKEGADDVSEGLNVAFGHAVELWGVRGFQALDDADGVGGGVGLSVEGGRLGLSGGVVGDEEHIAGTATRDRLHVADVDVKEFDGCGIAGGGGREGATFHFALRAGVAGFIVGEERGGGEVGGCAIVDHVLEAVVGGVAEAGVEGGGRLIEFGADGADDLDFFEGEGSRVEMAVLVADLGGEAGVVGARRVEGGGEVVEVFRAREEEGVGGVGGGAAGAAINVARTLIFGDEVEMVVFEGICAKKVSRGIGGRGYGG